jgi:anion-transporting  ArsA/GET3 family ATPase
MDDLHPDGAAAALPALLAPRLLYVTGKGGVGRSTVAVALALEAARRGARPLIVELGERQAAARILTPPGAAPLKVGHRPVALAGGVHAMCLDIDEAISAYFREHIPMQRIVSGLLNNRVLRRFFEAAPSVPEVATLNTLVALEREQGSDGLPAWHPILIDLEATGHALMLLDLPRVLTGLVGQGPMRGLVDGFEATFRDPHRSSLIVVTNPSELPVQEAGQLVRAVRSRGSLRIGAVIVNKLPDIQEVHVQRDHVQRLADRARLQRQTDVADDLAYALRDAAAVARAHVLCDELAEQVEAPVIKLPRLAHGRIDLARLQRLGAVAVDPQAVVEVAP